MGAAGFEAAGPGADPRAFGGDEARDRAGVGALPPDALAVTRAASVTCDPLPPLPVGLFSRAAAIIAQRSACGGATLDQLEAIISRGASQQARLLAGVA